MRTYAAMVACTLALVLTSASLAGQEREVRFPSYPISDECGSDACEVTAMMLVSILGMLEWDTDLARAQGSPIVARVLDTVHHDPANSACFSYGNSPALASVSISLQFFAERRGKPLTLASCEDVLAPADSEDLLTPGPPVLVLSPVDWMGLDDARLKVAVYLAPTWHGVDYIVYLHRGANGWTVTRVGAARAR